MTNYNERLDKIFAPLIDSPSLTLTTTYWGEAKQALYADLMELIPKTVDTSKYSCDDSEHSFGLGYIQANLELEAKIKDYLGIEDEV